MPAEIGKKQYGLTAAALKTTAVVLMFINHFSVALFWYGFLDVSSWYYEFQWYLTRAAFILFAFQIAEGMVHTGNRKKYLIRLLTMSFASEFFYDELFYFRFPFWRAQNVFFTLFLGALAIAVMDRYRTKPLLAIVLTALILAVSAVVHGDYGLMGVSVILLLYCLRDRRGLMFLTVAAAVFVLWFLQKWIDCLIYGRDFLFSDYLHNGIQELHGILAFPLIDFYNGRKGRQLPKQFYYFFYPGHLLLILMFVRIFA